MNDNAGMGRKRKKDIESFGFGEGELLSGKYEVGDFLGAGWEGEVYKLREVSTGIERAGKFFFPKRNRGNRALRFHAKKLHKLRDCPMVIQYLTQETHSHDEVPVKYLVSEYVDGIVLKDFLREQRGGRLGAFQALHLLHALATGIDAIHQAGEYHGDLHTENIIVRRHGLRFDLKVLDMYSWGSPTRENMQHDIVDIIGIFYEAVGGRKHYARQRDEVKSICCGLKKSLILGKFRTAARLKSSLENMEWD